MNIREEIAVFVKILKEGAGYTGKAIAELSEAFGTKFSEGTLVKAFQPKKGTENEYWDVTENTLKEIHIVLKGILKSEQMHNESISSLITERNIDLSEVALMSTIENRVKQPNILITWEKSGEYERNAKRVCAITPTLNWARTHILEFIKNAKEKASSYHYILTEPYGNKNRIMIEKIVKENQCEDKIIIKSLFKSPRFKDGFEYFTIPIPYGIIIYQDTHEDGKDEKVTIAVASISAVNSNPQNGTDKTLERDMVIDPQRTEELLYWFEQMWEELQKI